jgi:hypothetical protein
MELFAVIVNLVCFVIRVFKPNLGVKAGLAYVNLYSWVVLRFARMCYNRDTGWPKISNEPCSTLICDLVQILKKPCGGS